MIFPIGAEFLMIIKTIGHFRAGTEKRTLPLIRILFQIPPTLQG
jgi:hypothetical protein